MNGNSVVLDTNIVLYLLTGDRVLSELLYQKELYISFISQLKLIIFRKHSKLKLPDSIVLATARFLSLPLITFDADFKSAGYSEIIIYE